MFNEPSFISVIIPCRNEEKFISGCLDSILDQDYSKENLEVLVVDGISEDRTKEIIEKYTKRYPFIKLLDNPKKFTPFGLNIGIKAAKGEVIIRMDAHAGYEKDYVSKCVKYLNEYDADNIGGVMRTRPAKNTLFARAIALVLSHPFGAGGSYFRIGSAKPRWVDTVFGGCYKREVFDKIGFFNENLVRSQDLEFNMRLKKAGGKIILVPDILAYYYPSSTLKGFLKHNFDDGIWVTYPLKFGLRVFKLRHLLPMFFTAGLLFTLIFSPFLFLAKFLFTFGFLTYLLLSFCFSLQIAKKEGFKYLFLMPVVFATRHFVYGAGSLYGFIKTLK